MLALIGLIYYGLAQSEGGGKTAKVQTEVLPATNNDEPPKHWTPYALGGTTDNNMPNDSTSTS